MKKYLTLALLLACSPWCWGQNVYTLHNFQPGTRDVTTQTNTVNAWKLMAGSPHCKSKTLVAALGIQMCIQSDNFVYKFNSSTKGWEKQTAMGTSVVSLAIQNGKTIYALMAASHCSSPNLGLFLWTGSAWSPKVGCYTQMSAGQYMNSNNSPVLLLAGINNVNHLFYSTDGGNSWTTKSGSWLSVNAGTTGSQCLVDSSHNLWAGTFGTALAELPAIPSPNGTVSGCLWAGPPTVVLAWTSTGWTYSTPLENFGTWQVVAGISSQLVTGTDRFHVFAEDGALNVYHWNINAPGVTANFGGQWNTNNGCPSPSLPCHSTTTHTVTSHIHFTSGHGIGGQTQTNTAAFTNDIETGPWDFNPGCDPVFGTPADPECRVEGAGDAICNQSHQGVGNFSLNWIVGDSIDVLDFSSNNDYSGPMNVHLGNYAGYYLGQIDNWVHDGCAVSDPVPACPVDTSVPLTIHNQVEWYGGPTQQNAALAEWTRQQNAHISGESSPYVAHGFYIGQADANGVLIQGTQQCFGGWLGNNDFLYGETALAPACK